MDGDGAEFVELLYFGCGERAIGGFSRHRKHDDRLPVSALDDVRGLPLITIPGSKLEPGRVQPAFGLAGAERRADQALAARSLLGPAADIAARNAA